MNIEKIGEFILELRKSKNLTQEQLAELIPIGRGAVSKWERGLTIPDSSTLLKLSEIFNVTINEILCGQKLNKKEELATSQNITLSLYDSNYKRKRIILYLITIILILFLSFFTYYFINSYKSIKVYTISGVQDNIKLYEGIFVNTKNKLYFRIEQIEKKEIDKGINKITLYYLTKENEEKEICSSDDTDIKFIDYYGYNEYLDTDKIDYIMQNLYLKIIYEDNKNNNIKLDLKEDYINDNFFFYKKKNIEQNDFSKVDSKLNLSIDMEFLINKIKNNFKLKNENYVYENKKNNILKSIIFFPNNNTLAMDIYNKNESESWYYDLYFKEITYTNNKNNYSFSYINNEFKCLFGECTQQKEKIEKFWLEMSYIL